MVLRNTSETFILKLSNSLIAWFGQGFIARGDGMSLDKRSTAVLLQLVNSDSYVSISELSKRFNVSRRTIYYDIDKINDWLKNSGLTQIKQVRFAGLILKEETKKLVFQKLGEMEPWYYEWSPTERKAWLALYLLTSEKPLYLEILSEKLRVSRNTTIEDIKSLKTEIERFILYLKFERKTGYIILGKELNIRKAIAYYLSLAIPEPIWSTFLVRIRMDANANDNREDLFNIHALNLVYELLIESEKILNVQFTDDILHQLSLRLVLYIKRIFQGKNIKLDQVEKAVLKESKAFMAAKMICLNLEKMMGHSFPEDEQFYITTQLLGAKVNYSADDLVYISTSVSLKDVAVKIVNDFEKYACIQFYDKDLLVKNLTLHLKPAYYRIKYGIEVENQIVDLVKENYQEIFFLTKKAVHHFEKVLGKPIHENEIAYIALHLGGRISATQIVRKRVLVVCANGLGTSQMLRQQLEGLIPAIDIVGTISAREYEESQFDVDFVISTIPLPISRNDCPVFIVHPILNENEKESLLKKVTQLFHHTKQNTYITDGLMEIIKQNAEIHNQEKLLRELKQFIYRPEIALNEKYKPNLTELITEDTVQLADSVADWKEAIRITADPLLKNGSITKAYVKEMIDHVEKMGPYIVIAPKIAVPHAKPENGVKKLGMSLLRIQHPVSFSKQRNHDVQFVVILAAIDNESHLKALSQLTQLFSTEENTQKLLKAKTKLEFNQLMQELVACDD
ncbi:BglG family transcription antiterminator [Thermoactinomyces sp. AMNI-1]|uniref:BglG family transcription antiterminator n=1 Tax=Thermoactinomyces mirandus TaxID=2756294 RepID=A0A7W2APZ3_9BACL|nr:BglG family transcription antiterminator [Thermoactinomyces mirandus]